jgi:signal transduction histidine kinase/DNA-binding response OmpR family regulator
MKRLFLAAIAVASLLCCTSCGERKTVYRVGVSQCCSDDWREKMNEEIRREAIFHDNVEVEILSADDSNEKQIADIQHFIDGGYDAIIASPIEAEAITPIIKKAFDSGIPVVVFDRNTTTNDCYTAFHGADNVEIGRCVAQLALSEIGEEMNVLEIMGLKGSTPADERRRGFSEVMKNYPDVHILAQEYGNWNADDGERVTDSLLNIYKDVDLIYAHNDRMAIAAAGVARRRGGKIPKVYGIDAAPQIGIQAVAKGEIDASFIYPTEGEQLLRTAVNILEHKDYKKNNILPSAMVIDSTNAELMLLQDKALREETSKVEILKEKVDDYWYQRSLQRSLLIASIVILVLLSVLIFILLRAYWSNKRHHDQLNEQNRRLDDQNRQLEESKNELNSLLEQLCEATQSKLTFFTNVSHDLRTPLTLIAEPVERLSDADNLTDRQRTLMHLADKNVKILQRLINQILDFRKYENGKLSLNLTEVDLRDSICEWADSFRSLALKKHIRFEVAIPADADLTMAVDIEKLERIFFNIMSNAFKFTPANGHVDVAFAVTGGNLVMTFADTGKGMTQDEIEHIFERFYQTDKLSPNGSGIGLALVKSFVELHSGHIDVSSKPGEGTTFTVTIPVVHIDAEVHSEAHQSITTELITEELNEVEVDTPPTDDTKPTVLVIDDNSDIRALIAELLGDDYNIMQASGGAQGIKLASKYIPDLIICDVMMPGIDGMETCRRLKNEVTTSHISVLMLTACSMDEQRIEGYESGADGYLSKPFNSQVLLSRCASLIENRKRISEALLGVGVPRPAAADTDGKHAANVVGDMDSEFYNRFINYVEQEMGNSELSVEDIAGEMGLSRVQFYRKLKSITNYSPAELLRIIRLKRADSLLKSTEQTVSEISYSVGFSSPSYFTKCYREYFGEAPTTAQRRTSKIL